MFAHNSFESLREQCVKCCVSEKKSKHNAGDQDILKKETKASEENLKIGKRKWRIKMERKNKKKPWNCCQFFTKYRKERHYSSPLHGQIYHFLELHEPPRALMMFILISTTRKQVHTISILAKNIWITISANELQYKSFFWSNEKLKLLSHYSGINWEHLHQHFLLLLLCLLSDVLLQPTLIVSLPNINYTQNS